MKPQTQEEIEAKLNQAYENVIEKEEQEMEKQINEAWERGQGGDVETNTNKLLGGSTDKKYTEKGVLLGFIAMLLMFFAFNHFDQKNNIETIQILAHENELLKKNKEPENLEIKILNYELKNLKKENGYLKKDISMLERRLEAKK